MATTVLTDERFRIVGDITIKKKTAPSSTATLARTSAFAKGKRLDISYGSKKTANFDNISIIQARQPLTPESPYFVVEINKCGK